MFANSSFKTIFSLFGLCTTISFVINLINHQMIMSGKETNFTSLPVARPGLEPRASRLPWEHSANWATEPLGRPLTFSPCFIRFVPESARNNGGTTKHALFDAYFPSREPTLSHQCHRRGKIVARPGVEPRASRLPCEHSANWATEPLGRPLTFNHIEFVFEFSGVQESLEMRLK